MTRLAAPVPTPTPAPPTATSSAAVAPLSPTALSAGNAVAIVNNQPVSRDEWQKISRLDAVMSRLSGQPAPSAEETLDRLVNETLILQSVPSAAPPSPNEVEQRLSGLIAGWGLTDADVEQALAEANLTRADLLGRVARLVQVEHALNQLTAQTGNLDAWLAEARANAEIGLYQPLLSASTAQTSTAQSPISSPQSPIPPSTSTFPTPTPTPTPLPPDLPTGPNPQNLAPDFTLPTLSGEPLTLSSLRGKSVLINFWATWCPPCRVELPALQDAYNRYGDQIGFIAVDVKEDRSVVEPFVRQMGLTFPIALDSNGQVSGQLYRVLGIPTTVFINTQGVIAARHVGPLTPAAIDDYLAPLIGDGDAPSPAEPNAAQSTPASETAANPAPGFTLTAADGTSVSLENYRGQSAVVLVFYRGYT